jgi:hypothetical protein
VGLPAAARWHRERADLGLVDNTAPTLELRAPTAGTTVAGLDFAFDGRRPPAFVRVRLGDFLGSTRATRATGGTRWRSTPRRLLDGDAPLVDGRGVLGNRTIGELDRRDRQRAPGCDPRAAGSAQLASTTFVAGLRSSFAPRCTQSRPTAWVAVLEPTREVTGAGVYEYPVNLDFFAAGTLTFTARGVGADDQTDVESIVVRNVAAPHFFTAPLQPFEGLGELRVGELIGRRGQQRHGGLVARPAASTSRGRRARRLESAGGRSSPPRWTTCSSATSTATARPISSTATPRA